MIAAIKRNENKVFTPSDISRRIDRISAAVDLNGKTADCFVQNLPFMTGDATAGAENEFQAVVAGKRENIDLARVIETSNYYRNLVEQARTGETSQRRVMALERLLKDKDGRDWENSWVWFPRRFLNRFANQVFNADLKADKSISTSEYRRDAACFVFEKNGENQVRVPVSYLLKLALADAIGDHNGVPEPVKAWGEKMLTHFSNDNSSPELFSFYPVKSDGSGRLGEKLAAETLLRFLLTQALVAYAGHTRNLFEHFNVVFTGETKKVAYASGMAGEKMIPIQIITAVLYAISGLVGTLLFLNGFAGTALVGTQTWRVVSEFFRADFRGEHKFSMYQIMALAAIAYSIALQAFFPDPEVVVFLDKGFQALWHPGMILFLQGVWIVSFLHAGRSTVTASEFFFHVVKENI